MQSSLKKAESVNWIVLVCAALAVHLTHLQIMQQLPGYGSEFQNKRLVLNPKLAKAFSFGYDRLLADYYWLVFLQYYGDVNSVAQRLLYAPAYLHLIITLDPRFTRPYWFASFVLAGDLGSQDAVRVLGAARAKQNRQEAARILDQGIMDNPGDWTLPYIAGSSQYLFSNNAKRAAHYYRLAARVSGAPEFLTTLAGVMDSNQPELTKQCRTWGNTFYKTSGAVKEHARAKLLVLCSQSYWHPPKGKEREYKTQALTWLKAYGFDGPLPLKDLPAIDSSQTEESPRGQASDQKDQVHAGSNGDAASQPHSGSRGNTASKAENAAETN